MTENRDVRYVDTGSATRTEIEVERMDEELGIAMSRAGIGPGARIPELGYGHPHFLAWATAQGCNVVGTEINRGQHEVATAAGHDVHLGPLDDIDFATSTAFDAIVAFDVFEHLTISELKETLIRLHGLLAEGGVGFGWFPNGGSPFGLAFIAGDIAHKTTLNGSSMEQFGA
jgi:cyclopropane fatty-acyl-phospholipid synthase-like methyltransferase